MTTTPVANRWWAPSAPRIGPDPVDLEMLAATGDDPRLDLGASVLAAHRVGAAACEMAAGMPLVDAGTLIGCLADARAQLANPMIDSVCKSVEGEGYAAVLVRDVLDDAEDAAVDLFRGAVSRGVAPPIAAQRVGWVYGISKSEIGKYRTLATDPRANPVTVADAADRALFAFVEKLANAETERTEVSKITPAERRRRAEAENRDRGGRFATTADRDNLTASVSDLLRTQGHTENAPQTEIEDTMPVDMRQPGLLARMRQRYGLGGGTPPSRVGETVQEAQTRVQQSEMAQKASQAAKAKKAAVIRRRQQEARSKPRVVPTGRTIAPRKAALRTSAPRRTSTARRSTNIAAAVRERMGIADYETPPLTVESRDFDWTKMHNASYTHDADRLVDTEVGIPLTYTEGDAFVKKVQARPGALFRMGELTDLTGGSNVEEITGDLPHTGDPYENQVGLTARPISEKEPEVIRIEPNDRELADLVGDQEIMDKLYVMAADHSLPDAVATPYGSAHDDGYFLVRQETGKDVPQLYEFVVEDAIGHTSAGATHVQFTLDPNQLYELSSASRWETTYDARGFKRTRIKVTLVSAEEAERYLRERGDVGKADDSRPWVRTEARNAQGEWVRQRLAQVPVEQAPAEPDRRAELARRANQARHARERRAKSRQSSQPSQSSQPIRVAAPRQAARRQSTRRQASKLTVNGQRRMQQIKNTVADSIATRQRMSAINEFNFDPGSHYAVLSNQDWAELIGYTHGRYMDAEQLHVVGDDAHAHVRERVVSGKDGAEEVAEAYERDEINDGEPMRTHHIMDLIPGDSDEDIGGRARVASDLLERPGIAAVKLTPSNLDANSVRITTNAGRPAPIYVVQMDPELYEDLDPDQFLDNSTFEIGDHPSAVVSSETLWPDGAITSYAVPVLFYRQVPLRQHGSHRSPGRNPEGGR